MVEHKTHPGQHEPAATKRYGGLASPIGRVLQKTRRLNSVGCRLLQSTIAVAALSAFFGAQGTIFFVCYQCLIGARDQTTRKAPVLLVWAVRGSPSATQKWQHQL